MKGTRAAFSVLFLVVTLGLLANLSRVQAGEIRPNFDSIIELDVEAGLITLSLFRGTHDGEDVWYVIFDASDRDVAEGQLGVNWTPIIANALGSAIVQDVRAVDGVVQFAGTVDFSPERILVPNPVTGFPPDVAETGSICDADYTRQKDTVELPQPGTMPAEAAPALDAEGKTGYKGVATHRIVSQIYI